MQRLEFSRHLIRAGVARHDLGDDDINVHADARADQPGGDRIRLVVLYGLLNGKRFDGWTALYLTTTVATSVTGFAFPFHKLLPSHVVGAISLLVLAVAIVARYILQLAGGWRRVYVISAVLALYLNVFVAVVQAFLKMPVLKALAPTQKEPPFMVAQLVVLLIFVGLTILAAKRFHAEHARTA